MIKTSWIYILFYIQLALITNFIIYGLIAIIDVLVDVTIIFKPFVRYTFGLLQPVMVLPIVIYDLVNIRPLHLAYLIIIGAILFIEIIILLAWMIGLMLQPIIFHNPFAFMPPFKELNDDGAFEWFFRKTGADKKIKDSSKYILDLLKEIMSPEEFEAAQKRCRESFISGGGRAGGFPVFTFPKPNSEYIDYDFEKVYKEEDRKDDLFYRGSYLSIKQREDANTYRNMTIARPDIVATLPDIPDALNVIKTSANKLNIRLG
jgi:hypothetical protein